MKAFSLTGDKVKRGKDALDSGSDVHFVDEKGSMAIVAGVLYIDGQPAPKGSRRIAVDDSDEDVVIDTDSRGKAQHRREKRGGVKANG